MTMLKEGRPTAPQAVTDSAPATATGNRALMLEEALQMLNKGALYIIDDMLPQPNWPDGHHEKVANLIKYLDTRTDLVLTKQVWASGIIVAVKR